MVLHFCNLFFNGFFLFWTVINTRRPKLSEIERKFGRKKGPTIVNARAVGGFAIGSIPARFHREYQMPNELKIYCHKKNARKYSATNGLELTQIN